MIEVTVAGLVTGSSYAILAVCVVVVYRLVGVLNFGQAAIGAFGAYITYTVLATGLPMPVAVLLGLTAGGLIAGAAGWVLARWFGAPTATVRAVVAVVMLIVLLTAGFRMFGDSPRIMPSLVPAVSFNLAGVRVSLTTIIAIVVALLVAAALTLLLSRTRVGVQLQAMSEKPVTVQLLGINVRALSLWVWSATGALSTLAMLLVAPTRNPTFETMSFLIVPALAAALLGGFQNVWIAAFGGLAIGALEGIGTRVPMISDYRGAIPFVIIIIALVWLRRREAWDAAR